MRHAAISLCIILAASIAAVGVKAPSSQSQPASLDVVSIRLSNFAFTPNHLRLRVGVPVRFRFVNESSGSHNFTAPAFFAASSFERGSSPLADGKMEVAARTTMELTLTPRTLGSYPVECTHFLHGLFGMTGMIEVVRLAG
jgi:plastocyanin